MTRLEPTFDSSPAREAVPETRDQRPATILDPKRLSVGVLVTLHWNERAGGHVKCWERFAEAARDFDDELDLTIYFLGDEENTHTLSGNVRFRILPAMRGTDQYRWLRQGAGDTDLASWHGDLARLLEDHDVIHMTDSFSFSRTGRKMARKRKKALTASIHTDLPKFTEVYSRVIISRMLGEGLLGSMVLDKAGLPRKLGAKAARKLQDLLSECDRLLISKEEDKRLVDGVVPRQNISWLRRGIDKQRFNPKNRTVSRLQKEFLIPADIPVILFVGRIDDSKNVMTMAMAARMLLDAGHRLHVLAIGDGNRSEDVRRLLGPACTLPGNIPQEMLSWIYASADLFVFPSESEVSPNVVLEARASGLPVFISKNDGGAQFVQDNGRDGFLVPDQNPQSWARLIAPLLADGVKRAEIAFFARKFVNEGHPSWQDVLAQDLIPVWRGAAIDKGWSPDQRLAAAAAS